MYLYPYSIRSVRIYIGKSYIFRIKGKAPTFVRAYFYWRFSMKKPPVLLGEDKK